MSEQKYRADIDGLRSLAIIPVVLYHAGVPGFSGGFVGVDVFFVISGYLITTILVKQFGNGSYNVVSFYERRLRRIFPALALVVLFVLAISPLILLPSEFSGLGRDAAAALLFVANINFWRQSGYFASDAETKPLLHMWSLGVEEQFYLLAPLVLFLLLRYAPRYRLLITALIALGSFVLCVYLTPIKPSASFYLLPTRAWELMAGSWLALLMGEERSGWSPSNTLHNASAALGVGMILFAVALYSSSIAFPGYAALLPVSGAALVIYSGQHSWAGRLLAWRPLVTVGLISYSLYLWHWPLMVAFRSSGWLESPFGKALAILLSLVLAWATWRWVETPTRERLSWTPRRLGTTTAVAFALLISIAAVYSSIDGWPSRYSARIVHFDAARHDRSPNRERCHSEAGLPNVASSCVLGGASPTVAVWGDSHGVELAQAIGEQGYAVKQITYSSCPPAVGLPPKTDRPFCQKHNDRVLEYLRSADSIKIVVLAAYYGPDQLPSDDLLRHMRKTSEALQAMHKKVVVIGPYPTLDGFSDLPTHLARNGSSRVDFTRSALSSFSMNFSGTQVFLPTDVFCNDDSCNLAPGDSSLLFDAHHPSMFAARKTAMALTPILQDASQLK